jgi:hypothetical protein
MNATNELSADDMTFIKNLLVCCVGQRKLEEWTYYWKWRYCRNIRLVHDEGHLEQLLHIFAFLKKHPKVTLYMSPELPKIDYGDFHTNRNDFSEIYRDAQELLPH